jgi:adenylate cyclase
LDRLRRVLASERFVALAIAALVAAGVLAGRGLGLLEWLDLEAYDRLLALRPPPAEAGRRVAVVGYTEQDIMSQRTYPLPDDTLAEVLERILAQRPRAIGVDFYRDVLIPPGSERLEALWRRDPRIVMVHLLEDEGRHGIPPPAVLAGSEQVGFSDVVIDPDDTVRRAILFQDDEQGEYRSLALRVATLWLASDGIGLGGDPDDAGRIRLGPTPLPRLASDDGPYVGADDAGYQILIDFEGSEPFRQIPMGEVLDGRVAPEAFRDKIVLVGATADSVADLRRVPFGLWPGVFVHAHVASRLVHYGLGEGVPIAWLDRRAATAWLLLWTLAGALLGLRRHPVWIVSAALATGLLAVAGAGLAALIAGLWIPVVPPAAGWLLATGAVTAWISRRESADRRVLMQLFARHVSRAVATDLWDKRDQFLDGRRPKPLRLPVTVLFVDVKSFTSVAEGSDALALMQWVNELMEELAKQVELHGGFVDDYFGDGMKAAFGVPVPRDSEAGRNEDAKAAVRCAIAMEQSLARLNESWAERHMPTGRLRVGIDSGFAVAGSLGSSDRLKYTVLGDISNTAARLEGLDDSGHDFERKRVRVLVSFRTRELLGEDFELADRGEFMLKGKAVPIRAFEVLGAREPGHAAGG